MIHTFTLQVLDGNFDEALYAEYHNFQEFPDGTWRYYRGGDNHPLEINITRKAAKESMQGLIDSGWTIDAPKTLTVYPSPN